MPLPTPNPGEDQANFLTRCASDVAMQTEYPEISQRIAVCSQQFQSVNTDNPAPTEIQATEKEQVVCVFPFQRAWLEDYELWKEFDEAMAIEVIGNFENPKVIRPKIDKLHEYGESFGDVLRLFIDDREVNGVIKRGLFAEIKLNPAGLELIKDRRFTGLSPAIRPYTDLEKTTYTNVLWALSLVNYQGLGTTTDELQKQLELKKNIQEQKQMKNLVLQLGLKAEATEAEALEKVKSLQLSLEAAQEEKKKVEEEKLEMAVSVADQNKIIADLQAKMNELFESMKQKEEEQAEAEAEAEAEVEAGVALGIIPVSLKDVYKRRYKMDKEGYALEMSIRKPGVNMQRKSTSEGSGIELTTDQLDKMKRAGIDPTDTARREVFLEAYAKHNKGGN